MNYISPVSKIQAQIRRYSQSNLPALGKGLTPAQKDLYPYVQAEKAKREKRINWLKPIEMIFDLLQRGQYVTANTAEQITRNVREGAPVLKGVGREALEGLTGKEKGDWENVLWGGKDVGGEEFEGLFPGVSKERLEKPVLGEWARGKPVVGATPRGLTGFAANVLLDPLTYVSFGSASAAKSAATRYADDVVKIAMKQFAKNPEVLAKLAREGGEKVVKDFVASSATDLPKALNLLQKHVGKDMARHMDKVVRAAKKEALRTPSKELGEKMLKQVGELRSVASEQVEKGTARKIAQVGKKYADYREGGGLTELIEKEVGKYVSEKTATTGLRYLDDLAKSIEAGRYGGAGTRTARFMRKEFATGERYPQILRAWDKLGKWWTEESKLGGYFTDAWWSIMNKGVVGKLKKLFNIRNPYQDILAKITLEARSATDNTIPKIQNGLIELFKPLDENDLHAVREIMITGQGQAIDFRKMAVDMGVPADRIDVITQTIAGINRLTREWQQRLEGLVAEGLIRDVGIINNYLPIRRGGTGFYKQAQTAISGRRPGFILPRETTFPEQFASEAAKLRFIFPEITEESATALVKAGAGDVETDLFQMLMGRGMAQARLEQRCSIIRQFREMGFNLTDAAKMDDEIARVMVNDATVLQQFGLRSVPDEALEGLLFDKETADILERVIKMTDSDESLNIFWNAFGSFTAWWKAWATASPGFHFRNHYSNNVTGFKKHGIEWLNARGNFEAWAGTVAALNKKDAFKKLVGEGVDPATANAVLMKKYGGQTIEELSDYAARTGVIARHVMGFDAPRTLEEIMKKGDMFKKLNPMSKQFAPLQGSYQLSQYVENVSRFHSFLLDYKRAVKQGASPESAMEWAKLEAKKWFIDYSDLSAFEQKILKKAIPFYTWLRKNIANQIQGMFDFREMYAMLPKAIKPGVDVAQSDIPVWMRDTGYIPVSEEKDGEIRMFWPNLPHLDLNKIPLQFQMTEAGIPVPRWGGDEILRDVISNAHPLIKTAVELVGKRDVFYDMPLDENLTAPRLTRFLAGKKGDARALEWIDGFLREVGFEKGIDPDVNEEGQLTLNPKVVKALENNILFLKRIPQYWDLPEVILPALEEAKHKIGSVGDYEKADEQTEEVFQILAFYFGVKQKQLDVEQQRQYEGMDIIEAAQKERAEERKKLPGYARRKADYIRQSMIRQKKLGL